MPLNPRAEILPAGLNILRETVQCCQGILSVSVALFPLSFPQIILEKKQRKKAVFQKHANTTKYTYQSPHLAQFFFFYFSDKYEQLKKGTFLFLLITHTDTISN